jgi:hypothetical protein
MNLVMRCEEKDRLIAYLYGEDTPADRAAVESHLARCAACAEEAEALGAVRADLSTWIAPEVELGYKVVRDAAPAPPSGTRQWRPAPAWAAAAAAVLVLAAGAGLSNLQVEYGGGAVTLRTGWWQPGSAANPVAPSPPPSAGATAAGAAATEDDPAWRAALAETERRLRAEFARTAQAGGAQAGAVPAAAGAPARSDDLLRQVRALVEESERRQQRELALRLTQVVQDVEAQRRADLVRIDQNMGQIEGLTGEEAARQRELLNYLVRVSQQRR